MIENDKDMDLKKLIKETRLEKPGSKFTLNVMDEIYNLEAARSAQKSLGILNRNFWIFVSVFAALAVILIIVSISGAAPAGPEITLPVDSGKIAEGYNNFFNNFGKGPLIIAVILTATSFLLMLERYLSKKNLFS